MSILPLSKRRIFASCLALLTIGVVFLLWQQRPQKRPPIHFEHLTLERTGCLGPCPWYTVMIDRDGRVTYRTFDFIQTPQGRSKKITVIKHGQMPANSLRALIAAVESPEYSRLESSYALDITDMPSTEIKVSGREFSVQTYVYAVPCERDARTDSIYKWMKSQLQSGTEVSESPPVPDIFCTVEELVDIGSCARYWGQSTRPFMTRDDPTLPTPARCKVTP